MKHDGSVISSPSNRRSFVRTALAAAGAVTLGTGLLARATKASAQQTSSGSSLTAGDIAILQFLAAGEALEADFYTQYTNWVDSGTTKFRGEAAIESIPMR